MKKFLFLAIAVALYGTADAQKASHKSMAATQTEWKVAGARNVAFSSEEHNARVASKCVKQAQAVNSDLKVFNLNGQKLSVNREMQASRIAKSKTAAPAALKAAYKGNAYVYANSSWAPTDEWDVTPSTVTYNGTQYDCVYDVLPNTVFTNPMDFIYEVQDGNLVFTPEFLTENQGHGIFYMDYSDFKNGGSGAIVLELGEDGSLSLPEANANHTFGYYGCTYDENYAPVSVLGAYQQSAGLTYTIAEGEGGDPEPETFQAIQSYTGKGKEYGGGAVEWTMTYGKDGETMIIRNLVPASTAYTSDIVCSVEGDIITVEPQLVGTKNGYFLYLAAYQAEDGVLKITRDAAGHISLPQGEGVIVGAFKVEEFDPTYDKANYAGYWDIYTDVVFYAEDETIPVPAPVVAADATPAGLLFAGMSPSGYSYNANLSFMPAYANMVVKNVTTDEATAFAWTADKLKYNSASESYSVEESYPSTETDLTFATTVGTYNNITLTGWNGSAKSEAFTYGLGGDEDHPYTAFYAYGGGAQSEFEMSDGTFAVMSSHNPALNTTFYTNWGTPDKYSTSMSKIYIYGCKPVKPLYMTGIELPLVSFSDNSTEEAPFALTCKIVKCTRSATGSVKLGDVIATCEADASSIVEGANGLMLISFEDFVVEDEDGMSQSIDHLFLEEEFMIVLEDWDNGTFTGVIGSEADATLGVKSTWFEKSDAPGSMYSYGSWPTKLFVGYKDAAYGYLNTEDDLNITLPAEGGEASIKINPMLCGAENTTLAGFEEGKEPAEWVNFDVTDESYTDDADWTFTLKISAEAASEERTSTFRVYQPGAYLDITVSQAASTGIDNVAVAASTKGTYNVMGQQVVNTDAKGLYIIDGKKVVK